MSRTDLDQNLFSGLRGQEVGRIDMVISGIISCCVKPSGGRVSTRLKVPFARIRRRLSTPGQTSTQKIRPLSFTVPDRMKKPVPGRHGSSSPEALKRVLPDLEWVAGSVFNRLQYEKLF